MNGSINVSRPSAPKSNALTVDEVALSGSPPRWEIPGWRESYSVIAGITGRGADPLNPFDLGLWGTGPVGQTMSRWHELFAAFPASPARVLAHQVHGRRVLWQDGIPSGWTLLEGADGHATNQTGLLLLITVADCVPVYLVAPEKGVVALLHAGWRGTAAGILAEGLGVLEERAGVTADQVVMHAGVAISGPNYEVGAEVLVGLGQQPEGEGPWQVDLREILVGQARSLGVERVTMSGHCTSRDAEQFFSHRRSGGSDGRMVAYLGLI